jgi:FKBP-type peptidyl-prolyl cis-trans isomerase
MNLFNKTEAIGLFLSVAVMALALAYMRFNTDVFVRETNLDGATQGAVVAVSQTEGTSEADLEKALREGMTSEGELVKLIVDDVAIGSGAEVEKGDTVTVHYIGTTQSGVKFDSSYDRGQPFSFTVGEGKVIPGWEQGLVGMKEGGYRVLVIPSDMAYGNRQVGAIAPNTTLVFGVELLSIE